MRYKKSKRQNYLGLYKSLKPQTQKLLIVAAAVSILVVSAAAVAAGLVVYKASLLLVNTVKIENPNFEITNLNSLIDTATALQSNLQTKLLSKECKDSLQHHLNIAAFVMQPVDEIVAKVKEDCTKPDSKDPV